VVGGIKNAYQLSSRDVQDDAMMMLPAASLSFFFDFCETVIWFEVMLVVYPFPIWVMLVVYPFFQLFGLC